MTITTGLSGNEIYCLAKKDFTPGNIVIGNSVYSLGVIGGWGSSFKAALGGELKQLTSLIEEGRKSALQRMTKEAANYGATGITGVSSQLIFHDGNVEFLAIGSGVHTNNPNMRHKFTTADNGKQLYAQLDSGYHPDSFAFGNVVYSLGIARGLLGSLRTLGRGEVKEYSNIFNKTRHLALSRIVAHAKSNKANAVLGIKTTIMPFGGGSEMLMIGTSSHNPALPADASQVPVSSDLTNIELWNMTNLGYYPMRLLLGTSVYSLGVIGNITASIKSYMRGELNELTRMIYEARENALDIINKEAQEIGADDVIGVKTYVYDLGGGLIELLAIGTAMKKLPNIKTNSEQLPPQAVALDKDSFFKTDEDSSSTNLESVNTKAKTNGSYLPFFIVCAIIIIAGAWNMFSN